MGMLGLPDFWPTPESAMSDQVTETEEAYRRTLPPFATGRRSKALVAEEKLQLNLAEGFAEGAAEGAEPNTSLENASQPSDPAFERLMTIRRVRYYPISFASITLFNFGVVRFLMLPTHFLLYSWAVVSLEAALEMYSVTTRDFIWRSADSSYIKVSVNMREPQFIIIYYADRIWTLIYKNSIRGEERLRRMRFVY